jgi:hypothetical protein
VIVNNIKHVENLALKINSELPVYCSSASHCQKYVSVERWHGRVKMCFICFVVELAYI